MKNKKVIFIVSGMLLFFTGYYLGAYNLSLVKAQFERELEVVYSKNYDIDICLNRLKVEMKKPLLDK